LNKVWSNRRIHALLFSAPPEQAGVRFTGTNNNPGINFRKMNDRKRKNLHE